jgi:triosephosphate isomerase (TIM)
MLPLGVKCEIHLNIALSPRSCFVRRRFIAGNWKMNTTRAEGVELAKAVAAGVGNSTEVDVAVCPPHVYLSAVADALQGTSVAVGAQNCYHEASGAFTGETSCDMLLDVGCQYVILGHSERRHVLGESNEVVNRKVLAALSSGLKPIVCVGETLAQREAGQTSDVVWEQFFGSLAGVTAQQMAQVVIAYEPVWAIGTGKVATPEQAEEVHAALRRILEIRYTNEIAEQVCIQYGGSVKPDNAATLLSQPNIDGALVGGAALKADSFLGIVNA